MQIPDARPPAPGTAPLRPPQVQTVGSGYIQLPPQRRFEKPALFQPPTVAHLDHPDEYRNVPGVAPGGPARPAGGPAAQAAVQRPPQVRIEPHAQPHRAPLPACPGLQVQLQPPSWHDRRSWRFLAHSRPLPGGAPPKGGAGQGKQRGCPGVDSVAPSNHPRLPGASTQAGYNQPGGYNRPPSAGGPQAGPGYGQQGSYGRGAPPPQGRAGPPGPPARPGPQGNGYAHHASPSSAPHQQYGGRPNGPPAQYAGKEGGLR
jgi:hypothetical protein